MIQDDKDTWEWLKLGAQYFLQYAVKINVRPFKFSRKLF